jgi:hypothetical protein
MTFWAWLTGIFAKSFFDFIGGLIQDARELHLQRQLGEEQERRRGLEKAEQARKTANSEALEPANIDQTIKELENGTF